MNKGTGTNTLTTFVAAMAIGALSVTTTCVNEVSAYTHTVAIEGEIFNSSVDTGTISTYKYKEEKKNVYYQATEIISGEMRDFTEDEAEKYNVTLEKVYKPIGVNIFELC